MTTANLALVNLALGRPHDGFALLKEVVAVERGQLGQMFRSATNDERLRGLRQIRSHTDLFLTLVRRHFSESREAISEAFELVLRRKMLTQDVLVAQNALVFSGKYPALMPWLKELSHIRGLIARDQMSGRAFESAGGSIQRLRESRQEELERILARSIPEMNLERNLNDVNRYVVADALPEDAVLVEFYRCYGITEIGVDEDDRYVVFVAPARRPDSVTMVDLGVADRIDRLVAEFRAAIVRSAEDERIARNEPEPRPANPEVEAAGLALRVQVLDLIVPLLQGRTRLLIAADGDLCLLPFEALPTGSGRHVIDEYLISYLACGRDLMRFAAGAPDQRKERNAPLVIADPDFDLEAPRQRTFDQGHVPATRRPDDPDAQKWHFVRLRGTRVEGKHIASMLGVQPWLGEAALKRRLKASRSPQILHLATHGFFLRSGPPAADDHSGTRTIAVGGSRLPRVSASCMENPLLRSGLALAGANTWLRELEPPADAEDGLLTAEDVAGMDLTDTDLTVLSACDTGLGEVRVGEGVFGLRRSFVLAGVRTLVMSLWKVPDQQTSALMVDFYQRILEGEECPRALHAARLSAKSRDPHPFYWGAFVCEGHPGPLRSVNNE